jgi:hypothetical protein
MQKEMSTFQAIFLFLPKLTFYFLFPAVAASL